MRGNDPRTPNNAPERQISREFRRSQRQMEELQAPNGTQRFQTSDELAVAVQRAALLAKFDIVAGTNFTINAPNNNTFTATTLGAAPVAQFLNYDIPTGRILAITNVDEVRIQPLGGEIQVFAAVYVYDSNNVLVPGTGASALFGRRLTSAKIWDALRSRNTPIIIDPVANPGPYKVQAAFGALADTANSGTVAIPINGITLTIQHLEPVGGW